MTIKQETINHLMVLMSELAESISEQAVLAAEKMESSGESEKFRRAQDLKIAANELCIQSKDIKRRFPHLFAIKAGGEV